MRDAATSRGSRAMTTKRASGISAASSGKLRVASGSLSANVREHDCCCTGEWMRRPNLGLVTGLTVLAMLIPVDAKKKTPKAPELKRWIDGPIRYLTEKHETETFRSLKTDDDRILFIERFWARRDPHPETITNEYRQIFWERVREANELFIDSPGDGWHTDRGKIHILYGPPTEVQEDLNYRADDPTSVGGIIRWIYEGRVGGRRDVAPVTIVPFVRGRGGEYRVSYDPKLSSVFFNPRAMEADGTDPVERWMEVVVSRQRNYRGEARRSYWN